jgi:ribosomal protein S18 acetylase RimI-like enzyme
MRYESYDAAAAGGLMSTVIVPLYEDVYADLLHNPFDSTERFAERVTAYMSRSGFAMTTAYAGTDPVGMAFGFALPPDTHWWDGLTTPVPGGFTAETGSRTFALCEMMTAAPWRRQGIARHLHDLLLSGRAEERATLLVRQDNTAAQAAYASWGWRKVGLLQPFPDAPIYDALVLPLHA